MRLYELTSPNEVKYGGTLTPEQSARCLRQTEVDGPKWSPYPWKSPLVENLCGKFVVRVDGSTATGPGDGLGAAAAAGTSSASGGDGSGPRMASSSDQFPSTQYTSCLSSQHTVLDPRLASVCFRTNSPFGKQHELFHLDGHVTIRSTPGLPRSMIFKGVKGLQGIAGLAHNLFLDEEIDPATGQPSVIPLVHMGVITSCMGVRLQTSDCCYLENRISMDAYGPLHGWLSVETRSPDQCNVIRLSVRDWSGILSNARIAPIANDMVVSSKGSVVHRMSWAGLPWDARVEAELLAGCARVVQAMVDVC
jgi:hypothetical protein